MAATMTGRPTQQASPSPTRKLGGPARPSDPRPHPSPLWRTGAAATRGQASRGGCRRRKLQTHEWSPAIERATISGWKTKYHWK